MKIIRVILCSFIMGLIPLVFTVWLEKKGNIKKYVKPLIFGTVINLFLLSLYSDSLSITQQLILCTTGVILSLTAYMDHEKQEVYRFIWLIPATVIIPDILQKTGTGLLIFLLLQFLVFARFYGKADAFAFSICAGALSALGGDMIIFLIQMLTALILLFTVNLFQHNINGKGNLKRAKPFIPYIYASWIIMTIIIRGGF